MCVATPHTEPSHPQHQAKPPTTKRQATHNTSKGTDGLGSVLFFFLGEGAPKKKRTEPSPTATTQSQATPNTKLSHPQHQQGDGRAGICAFFFFGERGPEKKKHGTQPDRHHTEPSHPPHQAKPPPTPPKQAAWGPKKNFYKKKQKKRAATLFSLLFSW